MLSFTGTPAAHIIKAASTVGGRLTHTEPRSGSVTTTATRWNSSHSPEARAPGEWRNADADPFPGIDHTAIAISGPASSTRFFRSVFGFGVGIQTENRGPEQDDVDDVDDVHVSVTRLAP